MAIIKELTLSIFCRGSLALPAARVCLRGCGGCQGGARRCGFALRLGQRRHGYAPLADHCVPGKSRFLFQPGLLAAASARRGVR